MIGEPVEAVYRRYLQCLNTRNWADLGEFVDVHVTHNDRRLGLSGYRAMLESDVQTIPDLQFTPEIIVTDGSTLACRLVFRCTPARQFRGFEPSGSSITFAEHVFYRFNEQRIAAVSSLIDDQSVADQLGRTTA